MDLLVQPAEKGEILTAVMGELSWYHERHGVFVEVWSDETFAAPEGWRVSCGTRTNPACA